MYVETEESIILHLHVVVVHVMPLGVILMGSQIVPVVQSIVIMDHKLKYYLAVVHVLVIVKTIGWTTQLEESAMFALILVQ